jgi:suppressor for copper-sensitivity B
VLDTEPVRGRLAGPGIVAMRADWTRRDGIIGDYLKTYGRYGIPFNIVYGPGAPDGLALPELLTQAAVLDALKQAGATAS